jgi:hypothetical protein
MVEIKTLLGIRESNIPPFLRVPVHSAPIHISVFIGATVLMQNESYLTATEVSRHKNSKPQAYACGYTAKYRFML